VRLALAFLCLFLAGATAAEASPAVIRGAQPESYSLDLRYVRHGSGVLHGSERIRFVNRGPAAIDRVWLRLWANGPDYCQPRGIRIEVEAPARAGAERAQCSAREVLLHAPLAPGASGSISLRFQVTVRREQDRFGRAGKISLLGNVIPLLAVEDDRGLHLERYSSNGETFYSLAARWDATLRLPAPLRAATTGRVRSERVKGGVRTLHVATARARDFALAVGPFKVRTTSIRGVRIRAFSRKVHRSTHQSLRAARAMVDELTRRGAPFGGKELDVVLLGGVGDFGGMEYPELVFTMPLRNVVAHEVAHQWWYGLVGDDQYREPWLDEGFATYFEERQFPQLDLCDPRRPWGIVPPPFRRFALDSSMGVWDSNPEAYPAVVYLGGACALERLESDIGRTRMTAFFRLLQQRFRFGVMRTSDVVDAIRTVAPAYDVTDWMRLVHLSSP